MVKKGLSALFIFALSLVIFLTGRSNKIEEINKIVRKANIHIEKGNNLQKELNKLQDKLDLQSVISKDDSRNLEITKKIKKEAILQEKEARAALNSFKKAQKLDMAKGFRKYLNIETEAVEVNLQGCKYQVQRASKLVELEEKLTNGSLNGKTYSAINKKIESFSLLVEKEERLYKKLKKEAQDYYRKK